MSGHLSNGTMGSMWTAYWCDRCQNDHACHKAEPDYEDGCQLLARIYMDNCDDKPEIIEHESGERGWSPVDLECRLFSPCQSCDGGGDEAPKPFDPGPDHGRLFEVIDQTATTPMVIIPLREMAEVSP